MSGPVYDEQIWLKSTKDLCTPKKVQRLRSLADEVETYGTSDSHRIRIESSDEVAALLRAKADKIEAALETVQNATQSEDFQNLIKAVEWTESMDYSPEKIQEAWEDYGTKDS